MKGICALFRVALMAVLSACLVLTLPAGSMGEEKASYPLPGWPKAISIGTPTAGTSHHIILTGLGMMMDKYLHVAVNAQGLGGGTVNTSLIGKGKIQMASVDPLSPIKAAAGQKPFKEKITNVRLVGNMFPFGMHLWTRAKDNIHSLRDIEGKRFMYLAKVSAILLATGQALLDANGLSEKDFVTQPIMSMKSASKALSQKLTDAFFWPGNPTIPASHYLQMTMTTDCRLVPLGDKEIAYICKDLPYLSPGVIKGGIYKGVDEDVPTVLFFNGLVADRDLPDTLVYSIMDLMFDPKYRQEFTKLHAAAKDIVPKKDYLLAGVQIPVHAGAVKWYKDHGLWDDKLEANQKKFLEKMGESR